MNKPQIVGWELTKNENGVEMATLPAEQLRNALVYMDELEQKLNKHIVMGWQPSQPIDMCKRCVNNKPGKEAGLWCINNCISGSHFQAACP